MALSQYRKGGGGVTILYEKRTLWFGWRKVEVVDYRQYAIEDKFNHHMSELKLLVEQHQIERARYNEIQTCFGDGSSQDDPNHSDPKEMPLPKDSHKFNRRRGKPDTGWNALFLFVRNHFGIKPAVTAEVRERALSQDLKVDRVGTVSQPVGKPTETKQDRNNRQQREAQERKQQQ